MDMFDTRTMLGIVKEAEKDAKTFLRDRYFTNRPTFNTAKIDIDIVGANSRKLAPFVNPKVGGIVIERDGYKTNSYEAPEVSPMMVTTAEDMLKRTPGESIYGEKTPTQRAAEQLGKDLSELDDIITRREEAMCAEALFTGKVTVKGEGYDEVLNYWPSATSEQPKTTLSTLWTASGADAQSIMADLRSIRRSVIQKSGITPRELIVGNSVIEAMIEKLSVASALDNRRVDLGQINPQHLPNGVTYWGYLKDSALDIYSYDEWYKDGEVEKPMVPDDLILMASQGVKTSLAYGCVSLAGDDDVRFYEGSRIPDSWVQRANPSGRIVQIKSRPLPIIHQINGFHVIKAA
jgi:hypothetical protein